MALPQVKINIAQGRLGRIQPIGEYMALIHTATAVSSKFILNQPYTIRSLKEADDLGLNSNTNSSFYTQIQDFYQVLGDGATMVIMGVSKTTTFSSLTSSGQPLQNMLNAHPEITLLGISHAEYTNSHLASTTEGLAGRIHEAVSSINSIASLYLAKSQPLHVILGSNELANLQALRNYKTATYRHVSLLLSSIHKTKEASVGFTLGYLASLPVQRKLSRVRNGALPISGAYFTDLSPTEQEQNTYNDLHERRYLFIRTYPGRTGYYFADDLALVQNSNDYSTISSNRVINKLIRISQEVFVNEIGQEVIIEEDGTISPAAARYYERLIENQVTLQMVNQGALSNIQAQVDERQQVLQNDELRIDLEAQPVGYTNTLRVNIGFALALNNQS